MLRFALLSALALAWLSPAAYAQFPLNTGRTLGIVQQLDHWAPENGWWIIEDRPGTGFAMERQAHPSFGDIIFLAVFTYDEDGAPTFYTASLRYDREQRRASEVFTRTRNGQVFDDPDYRFPDVEFGIAGDAVFEFDTPTRGRWISSTQGEVPIIRQDFGYDGETIQRMTGRWVIVHVEISRDRRVWDLPPMTYIRNGRAYIIDFWDGLLEPHDGPEGFMLKGDSRLRPNVVATAARAPSADYPEHPIEVRINDNGRRLLFRFRDGVDSMVGMWASGAVDFAERHHGNAFAFRVATRTEMDDIVDGPPLPWRP